MYGCMFDLLVEASAPGTSHVNVMIHTNLFYSAIGIGSTDWNVMVMFEAIRKIRKVFITRVIIPLYLKRIHYVFKWAIDVSLPINKQKTSSSVLRTILGMWNCMLQIIRPYFLCDCVCLVVPLGLPRRASLNHWGYDMDT